MPPKTRMTPEQVAADLVDKTVDNPLPKQNATGRASCVCGWKSITRDSNPATAQMAWTAHMYAQGFRTSDAISLATATHKHEFQYN